MNPMTHDLAYWLSSESKAQDWELKYSLRSFEKFFPALGRVWILGRHKPKWLNEERVSRIAHPDPYRNNKDANLISKLLRISLEAGLSEKFITSCDDHILLKPMTPEDFKPYYNNDMEGQTSWKKGRWHDRLRATRDMLRDRGYPQREYEGHIPYMLEKSKVRTYLEFDYGNPPGYGVFTLYFNTVDTPNIAKMNSERIRAAFFETVDNKAVEAKWNLGNKILSYNDAGLKSSTLRERVEKLLPEPSSYEIL